MAEALIGLRQLQETLQKLPSLIVARALYKALDRAAGVIAAEVELRAPEGEYEELKDNVVVALAVDPVKLLGRATIGFSHNASERTEKPLDLIAYWVEFGHVMETHDHRTPKNGLDHVAARPFCRPAFDSSADRAGEVFQEVFVEELEKLGAK